MRFINSTPVHHAIILAFLLAGAAWTGWGFAQFSSLPDALPWHGDAGWRFAGLLAALSLAVFLASKIARLPYLYGAALATVLIVTVLGKYGRFAWLRGSPFRRFYLAKKFWRCWAQNRPTG